METGFCPGAQQASFRFGQADVWNNDQAPQFTGAHFLAPPKQRLIAISMDSRTRVLPPERRFKSGMGGGHSGASRLTRFKLPSSL